MDIVQAKPDLVHRSHAFESQRLLAPGEAMLLPGKPSSSILICFNWKNLNFIVETDASGSIERRSTVQPYVDSTRLGAHHH